MNPICPFCDSNEVEKIKTKEIVSIPFCEDIVISHSAFRCNDCDEEGDFDNSLDKDLTRAIDKANIASAPSILNELTQIGITMTYLEKALRLPFRTTSRWKQGKISHSALALLRLIRFSPPLLEVADDNFSNEAIARYQLARPWDFFKRNTSNPGFLIEFDKDELGISFKGGINSSAISCVTQELQWEPVK